VAGAATDTRKTSVTARYAARTPELATRAATEARNTALPARSAAGTILATGAAVAVDVAAAPARVLLVDGMRGHRASRGACRKRLNCRHRSHSNCCRSSATDHQRFHHTQFCEHAIRVPLSTHVQNIQNISWQGNQRKMTA
jgi:hypothetical protein